MFKVYTDNRVDLENELSWLQSVINQRIETYFNPKEKSHTTYCKPVDMTSSNSLYACFINKYQLTEKERLIIITALAPEIKPHILDIFFIKNELYDRGFTEFGGVIGNRHSGFLPTYQTIYYILSGDDLFEKFIIDDIVSTQGKLVSCGILKFTAINEDEPFSCNRLQLSQSSLDSILRGVISEPESSIDFPAKKLETSMEWEDLVLSKQTQNHMVELKAWLKHGKDINNNINLSKYIKPGYKALFFGPPGTGKTLTASLLGKITNKSVYRIDVSQLVSKYIGETEKNFEKLFIRAEQMDWILFFDEADSLFGQRTDISSSNDRYANQGTSYLLQRIEEYPNAVILATNLDENIDDAFKRRFQSIIYFPIPQKKERLKLWQNGFLYTQPLEDYIVLNEIAEKYEFSGGAIINIVRYCYLMTLNNEYKSITYEILDSGIRRELNKMGKTF